jgi:hypothetical protein
LACIVGNPGQARDLLEHLLATKPEADIVQTLRTSKDDGKVPAPANRLADYIEELAKTGSVHMDPATYRTWATVVARYSFETYELFTGYRRRVHGGDFTIMVVAGSYRCHHSRSDEVSCGSHHDGHGHRDLRAAGAAGLVGVAAPVHRAAPPSPA